MPDLDAKQLFSLVAPCWEKHPETRPRDMEYHVETWMGKAHFGLDNPPNGSVCYYNIDDDHASDLCIAQLVRWLANTKRARMMSLGDHNWKVSIALPEQDDIEDFYGDTLLEALTAAALSLPERGLEKK